MKLEDIIKALRNDDLLLLTAEEKKTLLVYIKSLERCIDEELK